MCSSQRDIRMPRFNYRSHYMVGIDIFQKDSARHPIKTGLSPVRLGREIKYVFLYTLNSSSGSRTLFDLGHSGETQYWRAHHPYGKFCNMPYDACDMLRGLIRSISKEIEELRLRIHRQRSSDGIHNSHQKPKSRLRTHPSRRDNMSGSC